VRFYFHPRADGEFDQAVQHYEDRQSRGAKSITKDHSPSIPLEGANPLAPRPYPNPV
jgi:hypothetical protein